jgi:hypothetical protein
MKKEIVAAFMVAAATSAIIWVATPWLTGKREPWDANFPFYVLSLLAAGGVAGFLAPKPLWAHYLGSFAGQLSYEIVFLKIGPLILLGAAFLLGYCFVFMIAAGVTGYIRRRFEKIASRQA